MPKMKTADRAFKVLCRFVDDSHISRIEMKAGTVPVLHSIYNDLLVTVNNPEAVRAHSSIMHYRRELMQRMGLAPGENGLNLFHEGLLDHLKTLALKSERPEIDGAIIIDGRGNLHLEYGTREIDNTPEMQARLGSGRRVAGTGRRALQRISTFPNVHGLMASEKTFTVTEYAEGMLSRSYEPGLEAPGIVTVYTRLPDGIKEERVPFDKYEL